MKALLLVLSTVALLYGCTTPLTSDMSSPSIADTKTVVFGELPKTSTGKIQKYELRKVAGSSDAIDV